MCQLRKSYGNQAIAFIVLGSQGIAFTPVSVASNQPQEPDEVIVRDVLRSLGTSK
ncbi:hypothetical protein [Nostoc sp. PCC 7524]|uniref:hypothetical protein n=1 Tax=Nostoc sp. (strain ATCC 29411 / PCC 7524) TaxID=28072 RepID=UPI000B1A88F0|nr:hypothetical protein [Nostoc sp. PCC 7524]